MVSLHHYCTFFLDGHYFGVEVLRVQEVVCHQEMTRVPLAPGAVRGLINLRGQIVPAVDLRRRLDLKNDFDGGQPVNVVIQTEDGVVSLLVDEIGDVLHVPADAFEPPPENLQRPARDLIRGAYKLENRLLLILEPDRAVDLAADCSTD